MAQLHRDICLRTITDIAMVNVKKMDSFRPQKDSKNALNRLARKKVRLSLCGVKIETKLCLSVTQKASRLVAGQKNALVDKEIRLNCLQYVSVLIKEACQRCSSQQVSHHRESTAPSEIRPTIFIKKQILS